MGNDDKDYLDNVEFFELAGDPETVSLNIISSNLPKTRLDEIDVSKEEGQGAFISRILITKYGKAMIEKDEIIGFVQKNKPHLSFFLDKILQPFITMLPNVYGEAFGNYANQVVEQLKYADQGQFEKINVQSDRLIWLIYVLASQLDSGTITYDYALEYLQKPQHKDRISQRTLLFMLKDYMDLWDEPNRPSLEYLMLMGESARMINNVDIALATFSIVVMVGEVNTPANILSFICNLQPFLSSANRIDQEIVSNIERVKSRYVSKIGPDDF